eukprot:TRINITY_DN1665_c1_g2_i1.p1 TRINITY_DN1665_c1_g2~~TRINITY_DN1665_c1_g2_i1.p1  ORF type:complete len:388 (-),score=135.12 TRINITY_DN1665_c1_g2_i1:1-1059(-)
MKVSLILVLLAVVALAASASAASAKPKATQQRRLTPLLHTLGSGFDVIKGQRKQQVLKLGNDNQKTWYNPFMERAEAVPDNVQVWVTGEVSEAVEVQADIEAYATFQAEAVGAAAYVPGKAYQGAEVARAEWLFAEGEKVCAAASVSIVLYETVIGEKGQQEMRDEIKAFLPTLSDDSSDEHLAHYHRLYNAYGTHVVFGAQMGGYFEFLASYKAGAYIKAGAAGVAKAAASKAQQYREGYESGEVAVGVVADAEADFSFAVYAKGGLYAGFSQSQGTDSSSVSQYSTWSSSVKQAPVNIKTTQLVPMWELVDHPTHKSHMKKAFAQRLHEASTKSDTSETAQWVSSLQLLK